MGLAREHLQPPLRAACHRACLVLSWQASACGEAGPVPREARAPAPHPPAALMTTAAARIRPTRENFLLFRWRSRSALTDLPPAPEGFCLLADMSAASFGPAGEKGIPSAAETARIGPPQRGHLKSAEVSSLRTLPRASHSMHRTCIRRSELERDGDQFYGIGSTAASA